MTDNPTWVAGSSASGTNPTVPTPTGVADGDLLIVTVWRQHFGTFTPPASGWEPLFDESIGSSNMDELYAYYRFADSEGANLGTWTANARTLFVVGAYRGVDPNGTIVVGSLSTGTGSATLVISGLTTTEDNSTLVALYETDQAAVTPTPATGMTAQTDVEGTVIHMQWADQALGTAGATGSRTVGVSSFGAASGFLLALAPPPPPPPIEVEPDAASLTLTPGTPQVGVSANVAPTDKPLAVTMATPKVGHSVTISPAPLAITATLANAKVGHSGTVAPPAAALTATLDTPKVGHSGKVAPTAATITVTPATAKVGHSGKVAPTAASLAASLDTPAVTIDHVVSPSASLLALTPADASVIVDTIVAPDAVSLSITPDTPLVGHSATVAPTAASLTLSPATPTVGISFIIRPTALSLALTAATPKVGHSGRVAPFALALIATLATAKVGPSRKLAPAAATITATLATPHIGPSQHIAPVALSLSLTADTPSVKLGTFLRPDTLSLKFTLAIPVVVGYMPAVVTVPQYADQLTKALRGAYGPPRWRYVFEIRKPDYSFVEDITPWVVADSGSINLNNDRSVCRQLSLTVDATRSIRGATLDLDALKHHIVPRMQLELPRRVIGWATLIDVPLGLYQLTWPTTTVVPGSKTQDIDASDLCMQLQQDGPEDTYTVDAGVDCLTGTNAVADILTAQSLRYSLVASGVTTASAKTYDPGTKWLTIINDLLGQANYYALTFDRNGIARTKPITDLLTVPTDVTYTVGDTGNILIPWKEQGDLSRFANKVVITVNDPSVPPMHAVATNSDPDNSVSTVALGRTVTKFLTVAAVADQATLNARAFAELQQAAAFYRTSDFMTLPDPLREPRELYRIEFPDASDGEVWQVRNWTLPLRTEHIEPMKHTISRIERLVAA